MKAWKSQSNHCSWGCLTSWMSLLSCFSSSLYLELLLSVNSKADFSNVKMLILVRKCFINGTAWMLVESGLMISTTLTTLQTLFLLSLWCQRLQGGQMSWWAASLQQKLIMSQGHKGPFFGTFTSFSSWLSDTFSS